MTPVKNIIFDLGNVLYDIDFTKMYNEFENIKRILLDDQQINYISTSLPKIYPIDQDKKVEDGRENDTKSINKQKISHIQNYLK
jgi:FMN phosphatase YigB (HAD superfamily)